MVIHASGNDDEMVVDAQREWAIYRCGHGCLHVALDRLTVTLTGDEFRALLELMLRASRRFDDDAAHQEPATRAH